MVLASHASLILHHVSYIMKMYFNLLVKLIKYTRRTYVDKTQERQAPG